MAADVDVDVSTDMDVHMAIDMAVNMVVDMANDMDVDRPCFYGPISKVAQIFPAY
jgi:hypothetical protein